MNIVFFAILIFSLSFGVKGDLPVKCLPHQVEGEWKFEYTQPVSKTPFVQMNCGHEYPDNEHTSANAFQHEFKSYKEFKVNLGKNGCVDCAEAKPTDKSKIWTVVYNEGVDFNYGDKNIFTFFYFQKGKSGGYESVCSKTAVGWMVDEKTKEYSCIRGQKTSGKEEVNQMENKKRVVVEGVIKDVPLDQKTSQNMMQIMKSKALFRFKSAERSKLHLHAGFSDFDSYVKLLNSNPNSLWKAKNYDAYKNMTIADLNRFMGRSKGRDMTFEYPKHEIEKRLRFKGVDSKIFFKGTPNEYFSWENCLATAASQGGCGSCFAISSTRSIDARLKLQAKECEAIHKEPTEAEREKIREKKAKNSKTSMVSLQHALDCDFYNQGCEGGYPFLVGKFAHDNYLLFNEDYTSSAEDKATKCKGNGKTAFAGKKVVKAKAYGYIGGRYTQATEEQIMEEIRTNGPVVLSYEPGFSNGFVDDGIYDNLDTWVTKRTTKPEWTQVDHSVLAYGYGSDSKGNKYWLLQNSWGQGFGQDGNFKMVRGIDKDGIESMAEYVEPYIETN